MTMSFTSLRRLTWSVLILLLTSACSSTYYAAWEKLGKQKRDLLRDNVATAKDEQVQAQEQFKDALTRLKELRGFDGGQLEKAYKAISDDYEACVERADAVRSRIKKVDGIASDLFVEWNDEIGQMSNPAFKTDSKKKLAETKQKYATLYTAMSTAEKRLEPVLGKMHDYVLYLKHNLNAQAVGSLSGEVAGIEKEVQKLVNDMQKSISQADTFVATM